MVTYDSFSSLRSLTESYKKAEEDEGLKYAQLLPSSSASFNILK